MWPLLLPDSGAYLGLGRGGWAGKGGLSCEGIGAAGKGGMGSDRQCERQGMARNVMHDLVEAVSLS